MQSSAQTIKILPARDTKFEPPVEPRPPKPSAGGTHEPFVPAPARRAPIRKLHGSGSGIQYSALNE